MKRLLVATVVALSFVSTIEANNGTKDIHVVPTHNPSMSHSTSHRQAPRNDGEMCYGTKRGSLFSFVKPAKSSVAVGEPLQISLKLNRKAYIYLIAVSNRSNFS